MQVIKMEALSGSRSRVFTDGGISFVLYRGELHRYHIAEGAELAEEDYRAVMEEVLPKRAKLRAMNLLLRREYTTAKLREKLQAGYYPDAIVEEALDYVASFRYIDDLRYAASYIAGHADSLSRRRIEQDLLRRGISKEDIQAAWSEWEEQGGAQDEERMIRQLLQKRKFDFEQADYRETQRQAAFLMRKGYGSDSIRRVLRGFEADDSCNTYSI